MQSITRIVLAVVLLTSAVASAYYSSAKLRRDGVLNLYPFPRVGRASKLSWQVPLKDLYLESEPIKKQLYAFPRVGRSGYSREENLQFNPLKLEEFFSGRNHDNVKRESENENENGMWFGPRLGRSVQTDDEDTKTLNERSLQLEQIDNDTSERVKRQAKQA